VLVDARGVEHGKVAFVLLLVLGGGVCFLLVLCMENMEQRMWGGLLAHQNSAWEVSVLAPCTHAEA
jgi:hypothetical protein